MEATSIPWKDESIVVVRVFSNEVDSTRCTTGTGRSLLEHCFKVLHSLHQQSFHWLGICHLHHWTSIHGTISASNYLSQMRVWDTTLYAKFRANRFTGGFSANGWNITKKILFIYTFFYPTRVPVRPLDRFSRRMAQMTRSQARVCVLGVRKLRNNIQPLKNPPKVKIWGKNGT